VTTPSPNLNDLLAVAGHMHLGRHHQEPPAEVPGLTQGGHTLVGILDHVDDEAQVDDVSGRAWSGCSEYWIPAGAGDPWSVSSTMSWP
jgi:hypothetical protein